MKATVKYWIFRILSVVLCIGPTIAVLAFFGEFIYQGQTSPRISIYGLIAVLFACGVFKDKLFEFVGKPSFVWFPVLLLLLTLLYDWVGNYMLAVKWASVTMLVCVVIDKLFLYPRYRQLYSVAYPATREVNLNARQ